MCYNIGNSDSNLSSDKTFWMTVTRLISLPDPTGCCEEDVVKWKEGGGERTAWRKAGINMLRQADSFCLFPIATYLNASCQSKNISDRKVVCIA